MSFPQMTEQRCIIMLQYMCVWVRSPLMLVLIGLYKRATVFGIINTNPTHNIDTTLVYSTHHTVKLFQLEAHLLASRNEVVNLKKDILHLTEQLQKKDSEIVELKKEIDILKEELILKFS